MTSSDATRVQRVEVEITLEGFVKSAGPPLVARFEKQTVVMRENDARDLMHAIGAALGYNFTKRQ